MYVISGIIKNMEKNKSKYYSAGTFKKGHAFLKGMTGRHHSPESLLKMRTIKLGKKLSDETKRKMSEANKGNKNHFYGKKHTPETLAKIGAASRGRKPMLGKHHSPEAIARMSAVKMGKKMPPKTEEQRKRMSLASPKFWLGKKLSLAHRKALSEGQKRVGNRPPPQCMEKNRNWQGGKSFEIYPKEFSRKLKLMIRQRDNFTCQRCGITEEESIITQGRVLCVNHIDFDKRNCDLKNLNTLCGICNLLVNNDRPHWTKYFQDLINQNG